MNIADFFIDKYNELEAERDALRKELETIKAENKDYGVFDLSAGADMVKVELASEYRFTDKSCNIVHLGTKRIREIMGKTQDELILWAKAFSVGSYYGKMLEVRSERYRYTIKTVDMDGQTLYAFDPRKSTDLVKIDCDEYDLGEWAPKGNLGELERKAYTEIIDYMNRALVKAQEIEDEKESANADE